MASLLFPPSFVRTHDSSDSELTDSYRGRRKRGLSRTQNKTRNANELARLEQRLRGRPGSRRHRRHLNATYLSDYSATEWSESEEEEPIWRCEWEAAFTKVGPEFFERHGVVEEYKGKAPPRRKPNVLKLTAETTLEEAGPSLFMRMPKRARTLLRRGCSADDVFMGELEDLLINFKSSKPEGEGEPKRVRRGGKASTKPTTFEMFSEDEVFRAPERNKKRERKGRKDDKKRSRSNSSSRGKKDQLYILFPDSFFRLLAHAICQFHFLSSRSVTGNDGRRFVCITVGKEFRSHSFTMAAYLSLKHAQTPSLRRPRHSPVGTAADDSDDSDDSDDGSDDDDEQPHEESRRQRDRPASKSSNNSSKKSSKSSKSSKKTTKEDEARAARNAKFGGAYFDGLKAKDTAKDTAKNTAKDNVKNNVKDDSKDASNENEGDWVLLPDQS